MNINFALFGNKAVNTTWISEDNERLSDGALANCTGDIYELLKTGRDADFTIKVKKMSTTVQEGEDDEGGDAAAHELSSGGAWGSDRRSRAFSTLPWRGG